MRCFQLDVTGDEDLGEDRESDAATSSCLDPWSVATGRCGGASKREKHNCVKLSGVEPDVWKDLTRS